MLFFNLLSKAFLFISETIQSPLFAQCVRKNSTAGGHNDMRTLGVIRYHPEIENVILPVGVAPLDLPTDDQITHTVADIVLAVNDEHYSVIYLGTGR